MLPLNQRQKAQYRFLRFFYVVATICCVPLALLTFPDTGVGTKFMCGISVIAFLAFVFFFRSILFPSDLRGAMVTVLGLVINYGIIVSLVPNGWLFGFFYIFYFTLGVQLIILLGYIFFTLTGKSYNLPHPFTSFLIGKKKSRQLIIFVLWATGIVTGLFIFSDEFKRGIDSAPDDQLFWIWIGLGLDLVQQVFGTIKIIVAKGYAKEINVQQAKLTEGLNPWINVVFSVVTAATIVLLFL